MGIDGKAQGAATVAGVIVGAFVAFVNSARLGDVLSQASSTAIRTTLLTSWIGAIVTVILCVLAMRVRNAPPQFIAEEQIDEALELAAVEDSSDMAERVLRYYQVQLTNAKTSLEAMHAHVQNKGRWLFGPQVTLLISLAVTDGVHTCGDRHAHCANQPLKNGAAVVQTRTRSMPPWFAACT